MSGVARAMAVVLAASNHDCNPRTALRVGVRRRARERFPRLASVLAAFVDPVGSTRSDPAHVWVPSPGDNVAVVVTTWLDFEELVTGLADLQRGKVLDLARRLRPGLTLEDIANPHDFPELADPDWQFESGMLAGVESVLAAVRARRREAEG
jgi:hypothetical protein